MAMAAADAAIATAKSGLSDCSNALGRDLMGPPPLGRDLMGPPPLGRDLMGPPPNAYYQSRPLPPTSTGWRPSTTVDLRGIRVLPKIIPLTIPIRTISA